MGGTRIGGFLAVLFFALCHPMAMAQTVGLNTSLSFEEDNLTFSQVIEGFEQRIGLPVQYDASLIPGKKRYQIRYKNVKAKVALADFLAQNGLEYLYVNQALILKKRIPLVPKKTFVLSGRVMVLQSGEYLGNAEITLNGGVESHYTTDAGYFSMILTKDTNVVFVKYPGFETYADTILGDRDYFVNFQLVPVSAVMPGAIVLAAPESGAVQNGHSDHYQVTRKRLRQLPHLLGEPDVIRVMSLYPGVVGGSEGMLGMYIRGGASDQNLVLLDDVPVFNSYHLYGIFSIFNEDAIKSASLLKGSFPSRYGGRLSSVVSVQSKEGNAYRLKGTLSIGILASKVFLEGPLIKNRTTFTLAYRRSYLDFLAGPVSRLFLKGDSLGNNVYYFWDVNARVTHRFSNRSRLTASFYTGRDIGGIDEKNEFVSPEAAVSERKQQLSTWGNMVGSLKWNYYIGSKTGLTVKMHYTGYDYSFIQRYSINKTLSNVQKPPVNDNTEYKLTNGIADLETSFLLTHTVSNAISVNFGGGAVQHRFVPGDRSLRSSISGIETELLFNDPRVSTPELFGFTEINSSINQRLFVQGGLRISSYRFGKSAYYILPEPRLSMRYRLSDRSWLKGGIMRNRQFFHLLTNLTLGLPSDIWVPSVTRYQPSQSDQLSLGYSYGKSSWQLSTEVFYKKQNFLLEYKENAGYVTSAQNWEEAVTDGSGEAYGWEFMLEKTKDRLTGWISYAWMHNWRQFQELNQGNRFPARYDRRHNLYIAGVYRINDKVDFSLSWTYNSGFAITTPVGRYLSPAPGDPYREIFIYGDRNNTRTRDNHRLDIAFNFEKHVFSSGRRPAYTRLWSVGLFNAYNRRNAFYVNLTYDKNGERVLSQISLLPILPTVSYKISF